MRTLWLALALSFFPSVARADDAEVEAAKAHYLAGQSYYDQARYKEAATEFQEAYRHSHRAALLYNIALCEEHLGEPGQSAATLERFLAEEKNARDRALIETRIANLQQAERERQQKLLPPPTVAPPAATVEKPPVHRRWTWVAAGGAGALLLGSAVSGAVALSRQSDLKMKCPGGVCDAGAYPDVAGEISSGHTAAIVSDVCLGVAVVAIIAGVVLYFVEPDAAH